MKSIYNKLISWANTPYSFFVIFIIAFFESIFSLFPLTILFITLAIVKPKNSLKLAFFTVLGATIGAIVSYSIGYFLWISPNGEFTSVANFFFENIPFFNVAEYENIKQLYSQWGFLIIFIASFTPMPFELLAVTSGVFNLNIFLFITATFIGRGARFFIIGFLVWKYRENVKHFAEKYFNHISIVLTTCIVMVVVIIKLFL